MFCRAVMFVLLCFLSSVSAFELSPPEVVGDLALQVDTYSFLNEDGLYEEIAIRFPAEHLTFVPQGDSLLVTQYTPRLQVFDMQDNLVKKIEGLRQYTMPSAASVVERFVDDIARFQLSPGDYRAILVVEAGDNAHVGRATFAFQVPRHKVGHLFLSDLMFFRDKQVPNPGLEMHSFEKAGFVLLPEPARAFVADEVLGVYVNLDEIGQLSHRVTFQILDVFGNLVFVDERGFPTYREVAHFTEQFPLRGLLPGTYTLRVRADAGDQHIVTERRFQILGKTRTSANTFTQQRQDLMLQLLEQYSGGDVAAQYEKLSADERAAFAYGHWLVRQPYFARTYVGPVTGLGHYEMPLSILRALGLEGTLKKRVDKTFAERVPDPDTLQIRKAREMLNVFLDVGDGYASVANAVLALEAGALAEGDDRAQQARKSSPELAYAFQVLGLAKIGRKDWNGAIENFNKAKELTTDKVGIELNLALVDFLSGKKGSEETFLKLQNVASQDINHPWLHYMIGRIYERQGQLTESGQAYMQQVMVNPLLGRAHFDRGRVLFKQGHIDSATVVWRALMEDRPDFRDVCISPLLEAYLNTGETGKAQALIAEELRTLSDQARARVEDISLVASPKEWAAFEALAAEEQPRFVRAFWQKRDPTPATPGNERLVEHYRRVVHALRHFSRDGNTWDRRGDIYIRYGEPAHVSKRGDVRYETDQLVVRVKERLLNRLSPEAKQEIIARATRLRTSTRDVDIESEGAEAVEIHDFESIDFELNPNRVFFASGGDDVNTYIRGKEIAGRDRVGMSDKTIRGLPLYPVNGSEPWEYWIYPDVAGGIEVVFTALSDRGDYDFPNVSEGRKLARFNQKLWEDTRPEIIVSRAKSAQPDRYERPGHALDFHYASADFRGREDLSRLEVYWGVPIINMAGDSLHTDTFERGISLFDSTWTPIYRKVTPMTFEINQSAVEEGTLAIDELALQIQPGRYYLGVQINHPVSNRQGGYTQEIIVEDYTQSGLRLSDIELAGRVDADSSVTDKGGHRVVSMPSRSYKVGQPVVIYYEVYGLVSDAFGQTRYRVDYQITPHKGKLSGVQVLQALGRLLGIEEKSVVTISYEHTGTQVDEYNYIQVDPGDSKPGRYEISVTVTDQNADTVTEKNVMLLIDK